MRFKSFLMAILLAVSVLPASAQIWPTNCVASGITESAGLYYEWCRDPTGAMWHRQLAVVAPGPGYGHEVECFLYIGGVFYTFPCDALMN